MLCSHCGNDSLVRATRDLPYVYKGEQTIIQGVTGDFCTTCGEHTLDLAESIRTSAKMMAFNKEVNAYEGVPAYIAKVRQQLDLDQRTAAEIFGGGVNAFSRYETGRTRPPLALVKLLKLLSRHPDLLDELRTA